MTRGTRRHVRPARGAPRRKMTRLSSFSTSAPACAWPQRAKRAVGVRGVAGACCGASGSATPARRGGERQRCVRKRRRRRSRCAPPAAAAHGCSALGGGARTAKAPRANSWMFGAARPPAPAPLTAPLAMAPSAAPERPRPAPERWPRDGGILLSEVRASEGRHAAPEREKQDALRDARAKHAQSACRCNGSNGARTGAQLRVHQHPVQFWHLSALHAAFGLPRGSQGGVRLPRRAGSARREAVRADDVALPAGCSRCHRHSVGWRRRQRRADARLWRRRRRGRARCGLRPPRRPSSGAGDVRGCACRRLLQRAWRGRVAVIAAAPAQERAGLGRSARGRADEAAVDVRAPLPRAPLLHACARATRATAADTRACPARRAA
jgi:hypothetical protein